MSLLNTVMGLLGKNGGGAGLVIDLKDGYRTEEQEKAVFYFSDENEKGCFSKLKKGCFPKKEKIKAKSKGCFPKKRFKNISDTEYDALVQSIVQRLDLENKALAKLGLDESEIEKKIPPFANYGDRSAFDFYWRMGQDDDRFRSSIFEVTYLFFTKTEILAYQMFLNIDWERYEEMTYEYHYKDITSLQTKTIEEDKIHDGEKVRKITSKFVITVPGDSLSVALNNNKNAAEEDAILGMKNLFREKKRA